MIKDLAKLSDLAEGQHGQVTIQQAGRAGVALERLQELMVERIAEWVVPDAVLRLRGGGRHPFPRLYAAWLQLDPDAPAWERTVPMAGVVSHGAAARVHGLGWDLPGPPAEFTLRKPPAGAAAADFDAAFHHDQVDTGYWQTLGGLPVTTPVRTLIDIVGTGRANVEQIGRLATTAFHKQPTAWDEITYTLDGYLKERGLRGSGTAWLSGLLAQAPGGSS